MSWFKRKPSVDPLAEQVKAELVEAVEQRKSALARVVRMLDAIPLDESLIGIGRDLNNVKKNGH